jgi:hypothetical protein
MHVEGNRQHPEEFSEEINCPQHSSCVECPLRCGEWRARGCSVSSAIRFIDIYVTCAGHAICTCHVTQLDLSGCPDVTALLTSQTFCAVSGNTICVHS